MPLTPDALLRLEEALNRLAGECVLAAPGRDEGLIPAYSLLGELHGLCTDEPVLATAVGEIHQVLDHLLESGQPFNQVALNRLRRWVEWFPGAVESLQSGQTIPSLGGEPSVSGASAPASSETAPGSSESSEDQLLEFELGENRELLAEFHAEAVDHLQQIEAALLALEQEPENLDAINSVFRSFHTLKGNAGFLGLRPMQSLAHEVESLLDLVRTHQLVLTSSIVTEILRSRDAVQMLVQQVAVALGGGQMPSEIIPVGRLIRAVRRLAAGETISSSPPYAANSSGNATASNAAAPSAPASLDAPAKGSVSPPAGEAGRVPLPPPPGPAPRPPAVAARSTIRVNTEKLDSLMDVVGELVIVQSQLLETSRTAVADATLLQRNVGQLGRLTKELQQTAMSLRMIPIKPTFQKMERLVRDVARQCGKKVAFTLAGDETELDRTMVEEIADPLVHMVRNALDHGIETLAERRAQKKSEVGKIHLGAYHQGNHIVIELKDDGRGIDPARILAKARSLELIAATAEPTREEIFQLIFLPGFSTAEKVTAVSGRGVGMDVVKRNIEKLRGKIEIASEIGSGSTFRIKLPLTMAIIDGLVLRVGEDRFIILSASVQMALRPERDSISRVQGTGELLDWRGRLLPLHRLHQRLGIAARAQEPWEGIVLIVESSGRICALLVDEMLNKQEVVIKNLGAYMRHLPGVSGGAILGDGAIALILDPGTLLQAA